MAEAITRDFGELSPARVSGRVGWPLSRDRGCTPVTGAEFLSARNRWSELALSPTHTNLVLPMLPTAVARKLQQRPADSPRETARLRSTPISSSPWSRVCSPTKRSSAHPPATHHGTVSDWHSRETANHTFSNNPNVVLRRAPTGYRRLARFTTPQGKRRGFGK
jgi:hypothetical protein